MNSDLPQLTYSHEELSLGSLQQIRLIKLLPGSYAHPLRCTLTIVNLDDLPEYEAISYTWATEKGDDQKSRQIHCDTGVIPITVNCHAALRRLRKVFTSRLLWVDSICINQSNIRERNHQVGLMDRIYRLASLVHICIYDVNGEYAEFLGWLRSDKGNEDKVISQGAELFRKRYFDRVWVIQEVVFAKIAVLHVNEDSVTLLPKVVERVASLKGRVYHIPVQLLWASSAGLIDDLIDCLKVSMKATSSDPRDTVYGMMSLMKPGIRNLIPLDYSLSEAQVFGNAIVACVAERQNLFIMTYAWLLKQVEPRTATSFALREFNTYLDNDGTPDQPAWLPQPDVLVFPQMFGWPWVKQVRVKRAATDILPVDPVGDASFVELIPATASDLRIHFQILPRLRVRAHLIDIARESPAGYDSWPTGFHREKTDIVKLSGRVDPLYQYFRESKTSSRFSATTYDYNISDLSEFLSLKPSEGATLFFTHYTVGFTDDALFRPGDYVFAIDSIPYPMLLRKVGDATYRIVTSCYVWAALELDYWNPGSRKGFWPDRPIDLGQEQTQMIEVY